MSNTKATLQVGVDGSQAKAGLQDIKREAKGTAEAIKQSSREASTSFGSIGTAAQDSAEKLNTAQQRAVRSLERLAGTLGKTKSEVAEYRAVAAGVPREVYEPLVAKIREAETAMGSLGGAQRALTSTSAELAVSEAASAARFREIASAAVERTNALRVQSEQAHAAAAAERDLAASTFTGPRMPVRSIIAGQNASFQAVANDVNEVNAALAAINRGAGSQAAIQSQTNTLVSLWQQGRISADQYAAAVKRLDVAEASLAKSQAQAAAAGNRFISGLQEQANTVGMSAQQLLEYRAAQLGVSGRAAPLIAQLAAADKGFRSTGMSAAQTAAAMRLVPAQMTDIVVSLQAGQAPMTVLLQQGGQLKDMFGGVGPAMRALGGYALGLVTPLTVGAAALVGIGVAAVQGAKETGSFERTLILTGNRAGTTADQLSAMARSLANVAGNQGKAAAALNEVAAAGRVPLDMLERVSQAAIAAQTATGKAVQDTVAEYVELGERPSQAIAKLNEAQNFLTRDIYAQITALENQGRMQDAARLAQETYANATIQRSEEVKGTLGFLERTWNSVTSAAGKAWDAMKGIGRESSATDILAGLERDLRAREENLRIATGMGATPTGKELEGVANARAAVAAKRAEIKASEDSAKALAAEAEKTRALVQWQSQVDQVQSRAERRKKEIAQAEELARKAGVSAEELATRRAEIEAKYKDPKGAATRDTAAVSTLQNLREQGAALELQLSTDSKLTTQAKARAEFEQQIVDLKGKKVLTAQQRSILADEDQIRAQLQKNEGLAAEIQQRDEINKLVERGRQLEQSIASARDSRRDQYDQTLAAFGTGDDAMQRIQSQLQLRREFQRYTDQLNKATPAVLIGGEEHTKQLAGIRAGLQQALADQEAYYARVDELQSSSALGAAQALANFAASGRNAYQMVGTAASGWLSSFDERLTQTLVTGKAKFSSFVTSVLADLARISLRQGVTGPLAGMLGTVLTGLVGGSGAAPGTEAAASAIQAGGGDGVGALIALNNFGGYRAGGGPTAPGKFYEVNEQGPELYSTEGRTYLMSGEKGGYVTPLVAGMGPGSGGSNFNISIVVNESGNAQTSASPGYESLARDIGDYVDQKFKQLQAMSFRQGGANWRMRNGGA